MADPMENIKIPVILITDDNEEDRLRFRRYLESDGFEVLEAAGGLEAMTLVERAETRIDLVISDVRMPYVNGCDLSKKINAVRPDLKVLFISGFSLEILSLFNLCIDKSALLSKSVVKAVFLSKVKRLLNVPAPTGSDTE